MRYLLVAVAFLMSGLAFGYSSGPGADPANGSYDIQYKAVVKTTSGSDASGLSSSISKGHVLTYDLDNNAAGAYVVTRIGENTSLGQAQVACIADKDIATGDAGAYRCVTKGYVDFARYDATTAFSAGQKLCSNEEGVLVVCAACVNDASSENDCRYGGATSQSGITALEAKASGTGSNLKVLVDIR